MLDMVMDRGRQVAAVINEVIGVSPAHAYDDFGYGVDGSWPYGPTPSDSSPIDCARTTPDPVNHFTLFQAMGEEWEGCVEARPEPFDTDDTPPGVGDPDSLWVPYLWPDERDGVNGAVPTAHSRNDYLETPEIPTWLRSGGGNSDGWRRNHHDHREQAEHQTWVWKYNDDTPDSDYSSFIERGPNAACPEPIVPLTGNRAALDTAITNLRSVGASGTNSAMGMAWGWRVLSPGAPFTEGLPYSPDDTRKIIILMTDGENDVTRQSNNYNRADYGAYGYLSLGRLGNNRNQARNRLDDKLEEVCQEVARNGREILVYTVMFDPGGGLSGAMRNLYRDCATEPEMFFEASSSADLVTTFNDIAADIRRLRLTQ